MRSSYLGVIGLCATLTTTLSATTCSWNSGQLQCNIQVVTCKDSNQNSSFYIISRPGLNWDPNGDAARVTNLCNGNFGASSVGGQTAGVDYLMVPAMGSGYFISTNGASGFTILTQKIGTSTANIVPYLTNPGSSVATLQFQENAAGKLIAQSCASPPGSSGPRLQCQGSSYVTLATTPITYVRCTGTLASCIAPTGQVDWSGGFGGGENEMQGNATSDPIPAYLLAWINKMSGNFGLSQ